jgi:hypothetical protein
MMEKRSKKDLCKREVVGAQFLFKFDLWREKM